MKSLIITVCPRKRYQSLAPKVELLTPNRTRNPNAVKAWAYCERQEPHYRSRLMKRTIRMVVVFCALLALLAPLTARSQGIPPISPDVRAIMEKMRAGKDLTEAEQRRLDEWEAAMERAMEKAEEAEKANTAKPPARKPGPGQAAASAATPGAPGVTFGVSCPPAMTPALPCTPPSGADYATLIRTIADTYGKKLDPAARAHLDASFKGPRHVGAGPRLERR